MRLLRFFGFRDTLSWSAGCEQNRIEKLKNEMISRRDDESVPFAH